MAKLSERTNMNLGIMLLRKSGKQGSLKFIVTLAAAALGTLILLFVFSITNAVNTSNHRVAWKNAVASTSTQLKPNEFKDPNAVISVRDSLGTQTFLDKSIDSYGMYFTGGTLPKDSPLDTYPKAGEYYVSPALADLMSKYPNDVLRDRFAGTQVGLIPNRSLSSPDELSMIKGIDLATFDDASSYESANAMRITDFTVSSFGADYQKMTDTIITSAMAMGAIGLIIPVMMLITTATALGAREREARYAALRLVGATKRQIGRITFIDSLAASLAGIGIGALAFLLLRPILFNARMAGLRFFPGDISVSPLVFGASIAAIAAIVWIANKVALRKSITSPLGTARKQKLTKPPRFWSVVPLVLCIAIFAVLGSFSKEVAYERFGTMLSIYILVLFMLTMLSLILAGGWLTKLYGRLIYTFNKKANGLLVSRRINYEARAIFRGIGGIVIAFFAGAFFITSLSTVTNLADSQISLIQKATPDNSIIAIGSKDSKGLEQIRELTKKSGAYQSEPVTLYSSGDDSIMSCVDAQRLFNETCKDGSEYISMPTFSNAGTVDLSNVVDKTRISDSDRGFVEHIYLPKNTSSATLIEAEKIVTANIKSGTANTASVSIENSALRTAMIGSVVASFRDLLYAGIILTIIVASLNLVVATVAGLFDRKGSFFTLRLGGAEVPFLKRIVTSESMLPLMFISLVSIACGFYGAYVFLHLSSNTLEGAFSLPEPFFWVCVAAVFILSYVGIRLILPMLNKLTTIESNRSE